MFQSRPKTKEEKSTKTHVDTIAFSVKEAESWKSPSFQRGIKINDKVTELSKQIATDGGVIPGIITFGVLENVRYLLDGQQRRQAFIMSGKEMGYADIRTCFCDDEAEMADEFVRLNSSLVRMMPDDILRGMEPSHPYLALIREKCPFVGYDFIRRGENSPLLSMSSMLRAWFAAAREAPGSVGMSSAKLAEQLSEKETENLISYLKDGFEAWGKDPEYIRLWQMVNLTLVAWLYRRTVLEAYSHRSARLDRATFRKCMMSLSADSNYLDWLTGRHLGEKDRAPAFQRIKGIIAKRLTLELGTKPSLPSPAWAHGHTK